MGWPEYSFNFLVKTHTEIGNVYYIEYDRHISLISIISFIGDEKELFISENQINDYEYEVTLQTLLGNIRDAIIQGSPCFSEDFSKRLKETFTHWLTLSLFINSKGILNDMLILMKNNK